MAPAQEHMFEEEPLPEAVVFDSDFIINVLHENEEFHDECREFASRLFDGGVAIVYSSLSRLDLWHGWERAVKARGLPAEMGGEPVRACVDDREQWYKLGDEYLKTLLSLFDRYEVRIGTRLLDKALDLAARYNLRSHDACLLACAFHTEVLDIVSLDKHFLRVDGIHVWNNGIPARRRAARPR